MPSSMSPRRPSVEVICTCVRQPRIQFSRKDLCASIFDLDNGDMKGMVSKDIIGHECESSDGIDTMESPSRKVWESWKVLEKV